MQRQRKFIKYLSEMDSRAAGSGNQKMITVDASDRRGAVDEIRRAANKNSSQIKNAEKAQAAKDVADAKAEENPQVKAMKLRRAKLQQQLAMLNDQISRMGNN